VQSNNLFKFGILTNFVELSPSWEAANCAFTQKLPRILWNPKVRYRVHKSLPLVPILSQFDTVHTAPSYLSKIYFNIVYPPMVLVFLVFSFLLAFPPIYFMHSYTPHAYYVHCQSHPPSLDHSNYTKRRVQVMMLLICEIFSRHFDFHIHHIIFFRPILILLESREEKIFGTNL
jgi:hypothetical protein